MGQLNGTGSVNFSLFNKITGNSVGVQEFAGSNFQTVIPLINAAIGNGLRVVQITQGPTTSTTYYDVRSITGDGESSATTFTRVWGIWLYVNTAHATNVSATIGPKDGTTGLLAPWGSAYNATNYNTAYGPNSANSNLASPVLLVNNAGGWTTSASLKDIAVDPGSVATSWTLIVWGEVT